MVSDFELVSRVISGDGEAFAEIVYRYQRQVFRICALLLEEPARTEDLTQHVFVRAFSDLAKWDPEASEFGPWLRGIARNLVREELVRFFREEPGGLHPYYHHLYQCMQDEVAHEGEVSWWHQTLDQMRKELSDDHAKVIEERYFQSKSVEQIAVISARSAGAVQRLLREARVALRDAVVQRIAVAATDPEPDHSST